MHLMILFIATYVCVCEGWWGIEDKISVDEVVEIESGSVELTQQTRMWIKCQLNSS